MNLEEEVLNELLKKYPDKAEKIKLFGRQTKLKIQKRVQKKINKEIKKLRTIQRSNLSAKEKID